MVAPNDILGYYRIIDRIGAGGMGEVWKAEDTRLGRIVAVKILPSKVATDAEAMARMRREARTAAQISSPNIATIYSFEEIGERLFIVMEYVEGEPLTKLIGRGPIPEADLCRIGRAVAEALAEAHAKGIVHRDIKPDNIIVNGARVKVLDFGIAKQVGAVTSSTDPTAYLTQQGMIIGTVEFMSPEQALGKPLDGRTDIFSLGIVLYQAATGRLPFHGETVTETITQIVRDEPSDAGMLNKALSANFTRIISRCLRKPREQRFDSAADLASALDAQLARFGATPRSSPAREAAMPPGASGSAVTTASGAGAAPTTVRRSAPTPTLRTGSGLQTVQEPARRKSLLWVIVAAGVLIAGAVAGFVTLARRAPVRPSNAPVTAAPVKPAPMPTPSATSVSVTAAPDTSASAPAVAATAPPTASRGPEPARSVNPPEAGSATADASYSRGLLDLAQARPFAARQAFLDALAADPHYARAHLRLGEMALLARDGVAAREQFEQALADEDRLDARGRTLAQAGLAIASGDRERARELVSELHRADPNDPDLRAFRRLLEGQRQDGQKPRRFRRP